MRAGTAEDSAVARRRALAEHAVAAVAGQLRGGHNGADLVGGALALLAAHGVAFAVAPLAAGGQIEGGGDGVAFVQRVMVDGDDGDARLEVAQGARRTDGCVGGGFGVGVGVVGRGVCGDDVALLVVTLQVVVVLVVVADADGGGCRRRERAAGVDVGGGGGVFDEFIVVVIIGADCVVVRVVIIIVVVVGGGGLLVELLLVMRKRRVLQATVRRTGDVSALIRSTVEGI